MNEPPPTDVDRQVALAADADIAALPAQGELEAWVAEVLRRHSGEARRELTVRFVDPEESQALNRDYRGRDYPTNVLSFPFEMPPGLELPLLGDLVICHQVVVREAREQDKRLAAHYAHMVVHGTLHLLGHDHIEDGEAQRMEGLEIEVLAAFGIADPYVDSPEVSPRGDLDTEDERPDA